VLTREVGVEKRKHLIIFLKFFKKLRKAMQIIQTLELFQRQCWQNLRDGVERARAFLSAQLPSQTELKLGEQAES